MRRGQFEVTVKEQKVVHVPWRQCYICGSKSTSRFEFVFHLENGPEISYRILDVIRSKYPKIYGIRRFGQSIDPDREYPMILRAEACFVHGLGRANKEDAIHRIQVALLRANADFCFES